MSELGEPTGLSVRNVTKRYHGVLALDGVSIEIERGEVRGLIGPNGAGKSTLIGIMSGFIQPDRGDVLVDGKSVVGLRPSKRAALGVARTFQQAAPLVGLSTLDNTLVGMHLQFKAGLGRVVARIPPARREEREARERARQVLADFGLETVAATDAGDLSFGQLRFLEIARATVMRPRYLLLDEPAAGLNATEMDLLGARIRDLANKGIGVLLVDHDVPFVFGLCHRVTAVSFGEVIAEGSASEVYRSPVVREAYLGTGEQTEVDV